MANKTPPKRDVMLALLQAAESVYVNFDPRRDGVLVPPQLKRQPRVVLQYGMNMAIPIPDLDVGEEGIGATLSFDRMPTWTFVPWSAVFAIVSQDQRGMLWEADVPREVQVEQKKQQAQQPPPSDKPRGADKPAEKAKGAAKGKRPSLRAVEGGQARGEANAESKPARDKVEAPKVLAEAPAPTPMPKGKTTVEEAMVPAGERPADKPTSKDEIVEPPAREQKKKRELPPYLRVVK